MVAIASEKVDEKESSRKAPANACKLCYGFHASGPNQGQRYPLCLACREEAARLAGLPDPSMLNKAWTGSAFVTLAKASA